MLDLLRRNRDFRSLFTAQVISYMGDWFQAVALIGLLLDITHSDLAASAVFVASTLPAFLVMPVAGAAADRFDRRRIIVSVSAVQTVVAVGFLLVGKHTWVLGFVIQAAISGLSSFVGPATQAAVPNIVDEDDLPTASIMVSSTWGAMLAIGAALGGLFTAVFGRRAAFVADAASFAVAGALVASVRRRMGEPRPERASRMHPISDTVEAVRFARGRPDVLALLGSKAGLGLAGGVVGLLAVFATRRYHAGDAGTGVLLGVRGLGAVLGPVLAARVVKRGVAGILLACGWAGLVYGGGYALVPVAPGLALASVAVLVAHLGGGAQWTLSTYGLQVTTPDELRGRIFAADFALVTLTLSISFFAAGAASQHFGPTPVTLVVSAVAAGWGLAYLGLTRRLRSPADTVRT